MTFQKFIRLIEETSFYSRESQILLKNKIGYRNPNYGEFGIKRALDVLVFEYDELGNNDIPDTLYKQNLITNPSFEEAYQYISSLEKKENSEILCVWVCSSKEDIEKNYSDYDGGLSELSILRMPNNYIILSDLGEDGILVGFTEKDKPVEQQL